MQPYNIDVALCEYKEVGGPGSQSLAYSAIMWKGDNCAWATMRFWASVLCTVLL